MHMFQHSLLSMLLVLVVYLAFQNQQLRTETSAIHTLQQQASDNLTKTLTPLAEQLDTIHSVTSKLGKAAEDANNQKLASLQQRLGLYKILGTVNQANRLRAEGKGAEAAEKLRNTKKPIWEAGETFADKKTRLQGLMGSIDKLVEAWKSGDTSMAADSIRNELEAVLGELGND